ncbi:MAG: P1 family peptidase [Candidatus Eremiobacteraeota bacterium]|nr:P1 family peptidase [Candidatus Eremiobacteraeota bacterium]
MNETRGSIVDVTGIRVGHAQDDRARTGCTVVLMPDVGAVCGVDVRGSAPGTRETDLLAPTAHVEVVHALVLTGGSAFGLDSACGVMQFLEERGRGYRVGKWIVPIVPAAVIFDLFTGDGAIRPSRAMGYLAADSATSAPCAEGSVGVGSGATAGKLAGPELATRSGVGSASRRFGDLVVGAIAVANSVGSVYDVRTGERLAGPRTADGTFLDELPLLEAFAKGTVPPPGANTTLAVIATNAGMRKVDATKIAQMAHDGLARAVVPAHLTRDGDTIFACATGEVEAPLDIVGILAAEALAEAIARGVRAASPT